MPDDAGMARAALEIRLADPDRHAASVAAIYRPSVESSLATFEEVPPDPATVSARIRAVLARTPWLVAIDGGTDEVIGYAYASPHHERAGYRWSVNVSVYVRAAAQGRGVGRSLYDRLLRLLRRQGFVNAYAGIALPNPASEALHIAIGMERIGVYRAVGYKHGQWVDVAWYGLRLRNPDDPPVEPIPIGLLPEGEEDGATVADDGATR
jgi:phosphinothricin acetyltransferase